MDKQHASKSTLFLMELVLVVFFFSVCAAICVNVFGSGQQMAKDSYNLSNAVMAARSAASCYKSADGDLQEAAALLDGDWDTSRAVVYYNKEWQQVAEEASGGFVVELSPMEQAGEATIAVRKNGDEKIIFQLEVKSGRGGGQHGA